MPLDATVGAPASVAGEKCGAEIGVAAGSGPRGVLEIFPNKSRRMLKKGPQSGAVRRMGSIRHSVHPNPALMLLKPAWEQFTIDNLRAKQFYLRFVPLDASK